MPEQQTYTPNQMRERRSVDRAGRLVTVWADFGDNGVEHRFAGDEAGGAQVRGLYKEAARPMMLPKGVLDEERGADDERAAHRERRMRFAHAALGFEPSERTRVLDGGETFAAQHVQRHYHGDDVIAYTLVLRSLGRARAGN